MIPWEHIDTAQVPGNGGELELSRRGDEFSITVDGCELMNSRVHGSEEALAELACARIADGTQARILIGGLGMGYTLAATLKHLRPRGQVVVAELVPAVVEWNQGPLAHLAGHPLDDPRVAVHQIDVGQILRKERGVYDAILMDVDNGPESMSREANDWLYEQAGLEAASSALRPRGVLAIWSARPSKAFTKRLRRVGFNVDEIPVRARGRRGAHHTIWIAQRRS